MNLRLHFAVISRFRVLVLGGLVVGVGLAFLSLVRVSPTNMKLTWRQSETWRSTETMLLTRAGTPFGAVPLGDSVPNVMNLSNVPVFYSQLVNSEAVRAVVLKGGPLNGRYLAYPVVTSTNGVGVSLPFMSIDGYAATPAQAKRIARRVFVAFQYFLRRDQIAANAPAAERIVLQVTTPANQAVLAQGRRLTVPIVLFLAVMAATLALAYILENLRPRAEVVPVSLTPGPKRPESYPSEPSGTTESLARGRTG
jgi:hypothetical protein